MYIGTWDLHQGVMRNKKHLKRQAANIGKDGSRKCEEGQRYEQLGRAASMGRWGEDDPASQKEQLALGVKSKFSPGIHRQQAGRQLEGVVN